MTPKEKLEQIHTNDLEAKGEITALLQYANGVTGEADTRLGDAVYRLAEGYGQGGGGTYIIDTTLTMTSMFDENVVYNRYETLSEGKWVYGCLYSITDQDTTSQTYSANFHASWNLKRFNAFIAGILPITLTTNGNSATIKSAPDLLRWRLRVGNGAGVQSGSIVSQGNTYNHQPGQYRVIMLCAD